MLTRRMFMALFGAVLMMTFTITPVAGGKPITEPPPGERPLTEEEQTASDARVAVADAYLEATTGDGSDLSTLSCIASTGTSDEAPASPDATTSSCTVPSAFLAVTARDQAKSHYCGPAVGQVIANYTWAMSSSANKYSQAKIAGWMQTDAKGYTNATELEYGLEVATKGAPRRPSGWNWVVTNLRDTDGDGTVADQLHGYVKSNVSFSKMPLAIPVKPHASGSKYRLSSWPKPVNSVGHWIAAYGWYGNWTNSDFPRIYYTDSSRDEGGSTGKFWDPTRHIASLVMEHTKRFVW